jgi:hypothetical protein
MDEGRGCCVGVKEKKGEKGEKGEKGRAEEEEAWGQGKPMMC